MDSNYILPDSAILSAAIKYISSSGEQIVPGFSMGCFIPSIPCLVIGQSNQPDLSIDLALADANLIPVIKRPTGGEAVYLSPRTFVISFALAADKIARSSVAFSWILNHIITALERQDIRNIRHRGISDLAIDNKKILGCSIYRRPHLLFFHTVLNIAEEPELIGKYLLHPSREPEYRHQRKHSDFVTSLFHNGYLTDILKLESDLRELCAEDWHTLVSQ